MRDQNLEMTRELVEKQPGVVCLADAALGWAVHVEPSHIVGGKKNKGGHNIYHVTGEPLTNSLSQKQQYQRALTTLLNPITIESGRQKMPILVSILIANIQAGGCYNHLEC